MPSAALTSYFLHVLQLPTNAVAIEVDRAPPTPCESSVSYRKNSCGATSLATLPSRRKPMGRRSRTMDDRWNTCRSSSQSSSQKTSTGGSSRSPSYPSRRKYSVDLTDGETATQDNSEAQIDQEIILPSVQRKRSSSPSTMSPPRHTDKKLDSAPQNPRRSHRSITAAAACIKMIPEEEVVSLSNSIRTTKRQ